MTALNFAVLALAIHRCARIIGWDTITQRWRVRWLGWNDDGRPNDWVTPAQREGWRKKVAAFLHCPWCQGFWLSLAWFAAWRYWGGIVIWLAWPLALSSFVGVYTKLLD